MAKARPIDLLKKGLAALKKQYQTRKAAIQQRLNNQEPITSDDENFIDHCANDVEEQAVIDKLDDASDYDRGLARLSSQEKSIVQKLQQLATRARPSDKKETQRKRAEAQMGPKNAKRKAEPEPVKKQTATNEQRVAVLDWHNANGRNQTKTSDHFKGVFPGVNMSQPLVRDWVVNEQKWRDRHAADQGSSDLRPAKRLRQTVHPEVDEMLELWVHKATQDGVTLTGEVIRQKWTRFADLCCIPQDERIKLSEGWLTSFKQRAGLKAIKRHGEAGSASLEVVGQDRERLRTLINDLFKLGYRVQDIFNMDETGLFYGLVPDRGLAREHMAGVKGVKTRLTYAFTINADGSEKRPAFVIGKPHKPRCFQGKTAARLGFLYRNNAKAWMTSALYREWIGNWDRELRAQRRKILLLVDNFSGHCDVPDLTNIKVVKFAPNITSHIQPADAGIIRCFKAHYRRFFIQRAIDNYDSGMSPSNIYKIDQLEAMRLAARAWNEVDATTIRNCWRKVGILPEAPHVAVAPSLPVAALLNPTTSSAETARTTSLDTAAQDPAARAAADLVEKAVAAAEKATAAALDELQTCGALHARNRMDLQELLNPAEELDLVPESSDEEIVAAVEERIALEQALPLTGGDDDDAEDDEPAPPTRAEALAASMLLRRYLTVHESDWARGLDNGLAKFGWNTRWEATRDMRPTDITSYFTSSRAA